MSTTPASAPWPPPEQPHPDQPPYPPHNPTSPPPPPLYAPAVGWRESPHSPSRSQRSGLAVSALVCGIFAFFAVIASGWFGLLLGIAAIMCAVLALRQISAGSGTGRGMAVWGLILGLLFALSGLGRSLPTTHATGNNSAAPPAATAQAAAPAQDAAAPAQANPGVPTFTDGVYEVGTGDGQIPPGTYKTDGRSSQRSCHWSRNKDASGELGSIISNSLKSGPQIMQVKPTDKYVEFSLGCTWIKE
jgi:hypothetical protein